MSLQCALLIKWGPQPWGPPWVGNNLNHCYLEEAQTRAGDLEMPHSVPAGF